MAYCMNCIRKKLTERALVKHKYWWPVLIYTPSLNITMFIMFGKINTGKVTITNYYHMEKLSISKNTCTVNAIKHSTLNNSGISNYSNNNNNYTKAWWSLSVEVIRLPHNSNLKQNKWQRESIRPLKLRDCYNSEYNPVDIN